MTRSKAFLSSRRAKITPEQAGLTQLQPQPAGAGAAPQRGRRPGRGQRRVLRPARTRQPRRRLRQRPRRPRPRPAARRGRAGTPGRPGPRRRTRRPHPPQTARPSRSAPACRAPRLDDRRAGVRQQRPRSTSSPPTRSAQALYAPMFDDPQPARPNHARFAFLDPAPATSGATGTASPTDTVAMLRTEAGRDPYDRALTDLVGELSTRSDGLPHPLGRPRRPPAPHRHQALPPPRRRRPRPELRDHAADRRPRPDHDRCSAPRPDPPPTTRYICWP